MNDKFKITQEEINRALLLSPYSLPDSPAERGLKGGQIKKYFYEFIRYILNMISTHLENIGADTQRLETEGQSLENSLYEFMEAVSLSNEDLAKMDGLILEEIEKREKSHNEGQGAHPYIQERTAQGIREHNLSEESHRELRDLVNKIKELAEVAYTLSTGRQKITPISSAAELVAELKKSHTVGDLILVLDSQSPDFIIFDKGKSEYGDAQIITESEIVNGEVELISGKRYAYGTYLLAAVPGDLEKRYLAKKSDLDLLSSELNKKASSSELASIIDELEKKEDAFERVINPEGDILLESGGEYSLGLRSAIKLVLPEKTDGLRAILTFRSGTEPTSIDFPEGIIFTQDDCYGGIFYPLANRIYEISIRALEGVIVARVGACDWTVIGE